MLAGSLLHILPQGVRQIQASLQQDCLQITGQNALFRFRTDRPLVRTCRHFGGGDVGLKHPEAASESDLIPDLRIPHGATKRDGLDSL